MEHCASVFNSIETCITGYFRKRIKLFEKLCGSKVIDILLHMPSYMIEKTFTYTISSADVGKTITTKILINCVEISPYKTRPCRIYGECGDEQVEILLFNYRKYYAKAAFPVGKEVFISGKLGLSQSNMLQFINPEKSASEFAARQKCGISNIYPLTAGITQEGVHEVMRSALQALHSSPLVEWLPKKVLENNNFQSFYDSLKYIHFPTKLEKPQLNTEARRRLCFDELLAEQIILRLANPKTKLGNIIKNEKTLIAKLMDNLPFKLTKSQESVLSEILSDLESGRPMSRLLQGDVGSGKTIVAIITALYAIESGYQCAILAPTEILSRQHYLTLCTYLKHIGITADLLTSNEKGKKRTEILTKVSDGTTNILVGTHAILTGNVNFKNLGLVIVDEQHRFGVNQRLQLINKGISPHVLSMTATPIPRTTIMSLYGDISVSSILEKPADRKEIITKAISLSRLDEIVESLRKIISNGQKVYWVCPLIEENDKLTYTCVINRFNHLEKHFPTEIGMLHGKMKAADKHEIFERFNSGNCNILVSTTVVEVGVDVKNASVIIIENAEKFGLAQIHQLRGRVGRSDIQSYCILLFDNRLSEIARKRIDTICKNTDGFSIAEQDLLLRGGGEILGTKQSGQKSYKTFDVNDPENHRYIVNLLSQASKLATQIVSAGEIDHYKDLLSIFADENFDTIKRSF